MRYSVRQLGGGRAGAEGLLTASLVEAFPDRLQSRFKLGVLLVDFLVGVLQECLEVLDSLVPGDELALCECDVSLEGRVLVDQLRMTLESVGGRGMPQRASL